METPEKHTISVLVENKFGVLARVAGLFSGRGYNISSLTVHETEDPKYSKMTIVTTGDLYEAISPALPKFAEHKALAKIYQALRIEVNHEMKSLEKFLSGAAAVLKPGGRLVVITYHSLEDRMVKNFIRSGNTGGEIVKDVFGNVKTPFKAVNRKPILPAEEEISANTRARSAKLRIAERVHDEEGWENQKRHE